MKIEKVMERVLAAFSVYIGILEVANPSMMTFLHKRIRKNMRDFTLLKSNYEYFPSSAIVLLNNKCSGTLISCKHVPTAAHCIIVYRNTWLGN